MSGARRKSIFAFAGLACRIPIPPRGKEIRAEPAAAAMPAWGQSPANSSTQGSAARAPPRTPPRPPGHRIALPRSSRQAHQGATLRPRRRYAPPASGPVRCRDRRQPVPPRLHSTRRARSHRPDGGRTAGQPRDAERSGRAPGRREPRQVEARHRRHGSPGGQGEIVVREAQPEQARECRSTGPGPKTGSAMCLRGSGRARAGWRASKRRWPRRPRPPPNGAPAAVGVGNVHGTGISGRLDPSGHDSLPQNLPRTIYGSILRGYDFL
jgi:hypothetical protein